jgi:hypothetical protein
MLAACLLACLLAKSREPAPHTNASRRGARLGGRLALVWLTAALTFTDPCYELSPEGWVARSHASPYKKPSHARSSVLPTIRHLHPDHSTPSTLPIVV